MSVGFVLNGEDVLSARELAKELGLSINTVFKGIRRNYFRPQLSGKNVVNGRKKKVYGFDQEYADAVKKVLPRETVNGTTIFSPSFASALKEINKRWKGKEIKW